MNPNNAPVLHSEVRQLAQAVRVLVRTINPERHHAVVAVVRAGKIEHVLLRHGQPSATAAVDQLTAGVHRLVSMASLIGYSNDRQKPPRPVWAVVTVGRQHPPHTEVSPVDSHEDWVTIPPSELPWVLVSTASGLRGVVTTRAPLTLKSATDPRLFKRPDQIPDPPTDNQGRL